MVSVKNTQLALNTSCLIRVLYNCIIGTIYTNYVLPKIWLMGEWRFWATSRMKQERTTHNRQAELFPKSDSIGQFAAIPDFYWCIWGMHTGIYFNQVLLLQEAASSHKVHFRGSYA